jgi:hypothetical protein
MVCLFPLYLSGVMLNVVVFTVFRILSYVYFSLPHHKNVIAQPSLKLKLQILKIM